MGGNLVNPSVQLVEAAVGFLKQRDFDAYLALLSPEVMVGINENLPDSLDMAEIRRLIAEDQVLEYYVDEVTVGPSVRVTVDVLHRHRDTPDIWMPSVYWVRTGRIERIQLGFFMAANRVWISRGGLPRLHLAQRLRRLLGG